MLAESYLCNGHSVDEGESAGVASAEAEDGAWTLWSTAATSIVSSRHPRKSSFQLVYFILWLAYIHDLN